MEVNSNLASWCHILFLTYLKCGTKDMTSLVVLNVLIKNKPEYMRHRQLKGWKHLV